MRVSVVAPNLVRVIRCLHLTRCTNQAIPAAGPNEPGSMQRRGSSVVKCLRACLEAKGDLLRRAPRVDRTDTRRCGGARPLPRRRTRQDARLGPARRDRTGNSVSAAKADQSARDSAYVEHCLRRPSVAAAHIYRRPRERSRLTPSRARAPSLPSAAGMRQARRAPAGTSRAGTRTVRP